MTLCACPVLWGFLLTIKAETKQVPQTYFTKVLEWRSFLVPAIFSLSAVSMLLETEPHHIVQAHLELTMQSKLASKLQASCHSLLSSRITGLTTIPNLNLCCHFSICYEHIQFLPLNLLGKNHGEKTAQHLCSSAHVMSTKLMKPNRSSNIAVNIMHDCTSVIALENTGTTCRNAPWKMYSQSFFQHEKTSFVFLSCKEAVPHRHLPCT